MRLAWELDGHDGERLTSVAVASLHSLTYLAVGSEGPGSLWTID